MANRIKGITVEIGGDTTGLDKALKGVNNTIRTTGNASILYKGIRYNLEAGTHPLGLMLASGENRLTISGTGSLTLFYRKGVL